MTRCACWISSNRNARAGFALKRPASTSAAIVFKGTSDKGKPGVYQELIVHLMNYDVQNCLNDPAQLDCLPRAWARICAEWAPSLFDEANVPPTDNVDWRPQETLPEDFYAA